jgi:alkylation response protein AidB-like acyl-CoA dehydrogenase
VAEPAGVMAPRVARGGHDVLRAARSLAPLLRKRAREGEHLRTMPADVVEAVGDAGLFSLLLPAGLGGVPCDALTAVEVIETLAYADGSAGWSTMIGNSSSFLAWLDPEVAGHVLATSRYPAITSVFAPNGQAKPSVPGTRRITGRWPFNSGSPHCDWFMAAVVLSDSDDHTPPAPDLTNVRFALFPAHDAEILETWESAGLQGTGSHDITVSDVVVPDAFTTNPFYDPARHDEPQCRLPFWTLMMVFMSGFPLGVASRALDEFRELAQTKSRSPQGSLANDPVVEVEIARAEAALDAARTFVRSAVGDAWDAVQQRGGLVLAERARVTAAGLNAMQTAVRVADVAFRQAGASAVYSTHPLQRCLRDLHVAAQHIMFSDAIWKNVGRAFLEVPQLELRI